MKHNRECCKAVKGYFTIEAALILPFVTGVILVILYLLFFQYNRCLLEQDAGKLLIRGSGTVTESMNQVQEDKYIAWEMGGLQIQREGKNIKVSGQGWVKFPFSAIAFERQQDNWEIGVGYERQQVNPVLFLRTYNRVLGGE